ncbi:MAG: hypothetical protein ACUVSF_13575 [Anaerolineae bacterium]
MQHARFIRGGGAGRFPAAGEGRRCGVARSVALFEIARLDLIVVGGGFDGDDLARGDGTDVLHAVNGVGEEQDEQLAGAGEFIAPGSEARRHVVLGMMPELWHPVDGVGVARGDGDAIADHVRGGEADDLTDEEVFAPGFEGVIELSGEVMPWAVGRRRGWPPGMAAVRGRDQVRPGSIVVHAGGGGGLLAQEIGPS